MKKGNAKLNFGTLGWILVIYCMLSFFFTSLLSSSLNISSGVFAEMHGWDYAWLMSLVTIGGWVGVVALWVAGLFLGSGKLKMRPLIVVCTVVCGLAVIIWGYTKSIVVYSIMFIIYQVCYVLWAQLANNTLCTNWFPRKKGILVGVTTFGFPIGAGPGIAIFAALMGSVGIGTTFMIIGIIVMVIGIIGALVITEYPEQRGRFPDNDKTMTREQADKELREGLELAKNSPWTSKRMLATKETWFIGISCAIMLMFASGSILQVVPRLTAIGYSSDAATGMLTAAALIAVPGSYLCGLLDQKAGTRTALIVTNILGAIACIMYSIPSNVTIWIGLICIGITLGGTSNYCMSATATYWGRYNFQKAYGSILGITQFLGQCGAAFIALIATNWNFNVAYVALAVICVIGAILMVPVKDGFVEKCEAKFAAEDAAKA